MRSSQLLLFLVLALLTTLSHCEKRFTTRQQVYDACKVIETNTTAFLEDYVSPSVNWTVTNPTRKTTPIAGDYLDLKSFVTQALMPLDAFFEEPLRLTIVDLITQFPKKEHPDGLVKVCMELRGRGNLKRDGSPWENYYSWVLHFKGTKAILVRAYLDSALVNIAMLPNRTSS
ncbi:hypothetical protein FA10DRAFT_268934 [Acaromyces ingoldii]|uniref:SnoaL-like domain-containing protein n=1 Tax=Acaromyces ingoldii TaxID=215250 RepID=A0A316YHW5_9BASI|nr:hypothetical protein FA10DRAFT_268934 [Acaromyces ingoldii]PWN88789.1 hypothetical protein FA10DRAFT_268934 [Acaromyces ingoldii]